MFYGGGGVVFQFNRMGLENSGERNAVVIFYNNSVLWGCWLSLGRMNCWKS